MSRARELYREGELTEAIEALNAEVRSAPSEPGPRTFLFELLCFQGDFDRAEKQLSVLASLDPEASMGVLSYQRLLECERERRRMYASGDLPDFETEARPVRGRLNGEPFDRLECGDPRLGARLEVYVAGQYRWIPFEHLASVTMEPPSRLRDLMWASCALEGAESLQKAPFGDAVCPALTPLSHEHPDQLVRLGRVTEWVELDDGREAPTGQKMLLVDGDDFPFLEVRELEIDGPASEE